MKQLLGFCCISTLLFTIYAYETRRGNEVKVYSNGQNIQPLIDQINFQLAPESLSLMVVDQESDSDVSVEFRDDIGDSNSDAKAYPFQGHVYIANSAPPDSLCGIFLHELLHCAGVAHEPEDPSSIMYLYSQPHGQLKEGHIRNLRRLSGMTKPERAIAEFRTLFY